MHIGLTGPVDLDLLRPLFARPLPAVSGGPVTGGLVHAWWRRGHRVTVFALGHGARERQVYDSHGDGRLRLVVVPRRTAGEARDLFRAERLGLTAAFRDHPTDLISAHWTYEYAHAAVTCGRPAFVTAHDAPLRCAWEMRSAYRWLRHSLAAPVVHRAHALSAVSPYTARHLRRCLGVRRPVLTIPNGHDLAALPAPSAPPPGDRPVFAMALQGWGRLKNAAAGLRAFALVRAELPDARLLLLGAGHEDGGPAHTWARPRGLAQGVEFAGYVPHATALGRLAAEAHVLLHPSRVEACPMVCAEAMGLGIPVIGGRRSGGVPWLVGDTGVLTDIDRPGLIAAAMLSLARDEERRTALGARARARIERHFRLEDTARAYLDWFTEELPV
ncbi:glycosyltransferase family 4 protein [Streptomyces monticola]|uniref:D-inositol 3-phosphate glycosyltransferase n=1 Tax=Streptomyces monticola TaxID=2666263 RepID=A0ABW2JJQ5_9ACTN